MNNRKLPRRLALSRSKIAACLFASIAATTGCSDKRVTTWTEEVKLANGKVVEVMRREVDGTRRDISSGATAFYSEELCIPSMKLTVKNLKEPRFAGVEEANGQVFIKLRIVGRALCSEFGIVDAPFGHIKITQNGFEKVGDSTYPGGREINLLLASPNARKASYLADGRIDLSEKTIMDGLQGGKTLYDQHPEWKRTCDIGNIAVSSPLEITVTHHENACFN